ncbi:hypothetical protein B0H15DRAFT_377760 [Mycena belliarum]|uniref:Uncharacterized protein n=1 Tax=Mycena belliarum TaxID=1033014 RepID=A0AAD6U2R8_9AGAR|nr:hypothetical protein B0H15DRAFT_377760 [Mycena belliae]
MHTCGSGAAATVTTQDPIFYFPCMLRRCRSQVGAFPRNAALDLAQCANETPSSGAPAPSRLPKSSKSAADVGVAPARAESAPAHRRAHVRRVRLPSQRRHRPLPRRCDIESIPHSRSANTIVQSATFATLRSLSCEGGACNSASDLKTRAWARCIVTFARARPRWTRIKLEHTWVVSGAKGRCMHRRHVRGSCGPALENRTACSRAPMSCPAVPSRGRCVEGRRDASPRPRELQTRPCGPLARVCAAARAARANERRTPRATHVARIRARAILAATGPSDDEAQRRRDHVSDVEVHAPVRPQLSTHINYLESGLQRYRAGTM